MSAAFERLLEIVLPQGGHVVTMIEAYFDESGCHDGSPVLVVAGYILDSDSAKALTHEWNSIVSDNGLTHFHMADCAHGAGEFKGYALEKRVRIQTLLIDVIKRHIIRGFGASVVRGVYDALVPQHPRLSDAYGYCIGGCLDGVREWIKETNYTGDVAYFFETGHRSQSRMNELLSWTFEDEPSRRQFNYVSHTFIEKRKSAVVQAADLLAWQFFTDRKHLIEGRPRRKDYHYLISQGDHRTSHSNKDMIVHWVDDLRRSNYLEQAGGRS